MYFDIELTSFPVSCLREIPEEAMRTMFTGLGLAKSMLRCFDEVDRNFKEHVPT